MSDQQDGIPGVSIHTPAWGVTVASVTIKGKTWVSIHTPAWGVTIHNHNAVDFRLFQSTLPRGE